MIVRRYKWHDVAVFDMRISRGTFVSSSSVEIARFIFRIASRRDTMLLIHRGRFRDVFVLIDRQREVFSLVFSASDALFSELLRYVTTDQPVAFVRFNFVPRAVSRYLSSGIVDFLARCIKRKSSSLAVTLIAELTASHVQAKSLFLSRRCTAVGVEIPGGRIPRSSSPATVEERANEPFNRVQIHVTRREVSSSRKTRLDISGVTEKVDLVEILRTNVQLD